MITLLDPSVLVGVLSVYFFLGFVLISFSFWGGFRHD